MRNKLFQRSKNQLSNKQNGKPPNPAANKPKEFGGNNDAEVVNSMIKKHNNVVNNDEDFETSESDDEVDQVNENEVKMETINVANETSESEDEVDSSGSEEENVDVENNEMETSSEEEVERENVAEKQNDSLNGETKSNLLPYNVNNECNSRTISVKHLPPSVKKIHLQQFFSKYGKIEEIAVQVVPHKNLADFYILFESEEAAQKSLEANNLEYKGCYVEVHKRNYCMRDDDETHGVFVSFNKSIKFGPLLRAMESFGIVKAVFYPESQRYAFVYFESVDSVELALAAGTISVGEWTLYMCVIKQKESLQHEQHQGSVKMKRPFKQPIRQQYQQNLEPRIQIHKNKFNDSVTITFNKSGAPGIKLGQKSSAM